MKNFKNKVVVITGAGSGMGRELALQFSKLGALLALNDFNQGGLDETIKMLPESTKVYSKTFDVSKHEEMEAFAKETFDTYNRVDVMINNAGMALMNYKITEINREQYDKMINVNINGVINGTLAFMPYLRQQSESSLVNLSSVYGFSGCPGNGSYAMTKFAVRGFSESLRYEEEALKTGVTVSCVHPGGIKTNIAKNAEGANERKEDTENFEKMLFTSAESAAKTIINGIKRKKTRIMVGFDSYAYMLGAHYTKWMYDFIVKSIYRAGFAK